MNGFPDLRSAARPCQAGRYPTATRALPRTKPRTVKRSHRSTVVVAQTTKGNIMIIGNFKYDAKRDSYEGEIGALLSPPRRLLRERSCTAFAVATTAVAKVRAVVVG